jgi:hypothetical protein
MNTKAPEQKAWLEDSCEKLKISLYQIRNGLDA